MGVWLGLFLRACRLRQEHDGSRRRQGMVANNPKTEKKEERDWKKEPATGAKPEATRSNERMDTPRNQQERARGGAGSSGTVQEYTEHRGERPSETERARGKIGR